MVYGTLTAFRVALSTSAVIASAARPSPRQVLLKNIDAAITVYYGGIGVTTAAGMPLLPGESWEGEVLGDIYAIAASGTPSLAVMEGRNS